MNELAQYTSSTITVATNQLCSVELPAVACTDVAMLEPGELQDGVSSSTFTMENYNLKSAS